MRLGVLPRGTELTALMVVKEGFELIVSPRDGRITVAAAFAKRVG